MAPCVTPRTLAFLRSLKRHNDRERPQRGGKHLGKTVSGCMYNGSLLLS